MHRLFRSSCDNFLTKIVFNLEPILLVVLWKLLPAFGVDVEVLMEGLEKENFFTFN